MSQKKVDQYKEYKANKKKIIKREKVKKKLVDWLVYIIILVVGTAVLSVAVGRGMYEYKKLTTSPDYSADTRKIEDLAGVLITPTPTPEPVSENESESETETGTENETESGSENESEKESESLKETESEKESESEKDEESEKESESEKKTESESEKAAE